jgi:hypothetical protein
MMILVAQVIVTKGGNHVIAQEVIGCNKTTALDSYQIVLYTTIFGVKNGTMCA